MNQIIETAERYVNESARRVLTSHITLSILLVFAAVALLRAFQLETKILLRGVILMFLINYMAIRTSQDYISSGKSYRDFIFKEPAPLPQVRIAAPQVLSSASDISESREPSAQSIPREALSNRSSNKPPKPVKPFQEDKTFEF